MTGIFFPRHKTEIEVLRVPEASPWAYPIGNKSNAEMVDQAFHFPAVRNGFCPKPIFFTACKIEF